MKSVQEDIVKWKEFYDYSQPNEIPCPAPFENLKGLQRLVVIRCIRSDKIVPAVQVRNKNFIKHCSA